MATPPRQKRLEKVTIALPLFRGSEPAVSAYLPEICDLLWLLTRAHAVLSLLHNINAPGLARIRDGVARDGILPDRAVRDVASMYPLELCSLAAESPLVLKLLSPREIAEALETILRLPLRWLGDLLDYRKKKLELTRAIKEERRRDSPLPVSIDALRDILYDVPEEFVVGVLRGRSKEIGDLIDLARQYEDLKQKRALTAIVTAKAVQMLYELPGVREAASVVPDRELGIYTAELARPFIINQRSELHFYKLPE